MNPQRAASAVDRVTGRRKMTPLLLVGLCLAALLFPAACPGALSPNPLDTWHPRTNGFDYIRCFASSPGMVVAGTTTRNILVSRDGAFWSAHLLPTNRFSFRTVWGVAFGNGRFVAVGPGAGFSVSPDGGA